MKTFYSSKLKRATCAAVLCLGGIQAATAGIVFSRAQPPAGSSFLVRYNTLGALPGPAYTVTGVAGPQNDRSFVDFSSSELLTAIDVEGVPPPYVRATDGSISEVDISVRDSAFTSLFINFRANETTPARFVDIMASGFGGESATYHLDLLRGNNLFLVEATGNTLLRELSLSGMFPSTDLWQVRVGGMRDAPVAVPEPATLLGFGIGMAGMLAARRRRCQAPASRRIGAD